MTLIIVQARMGSTRLPGKVMMKIKNKPLLYYVLRQIENSHEDIEIIVATTKLSKDDVIEEYVKSLGHKVFRGDEKDVLNRYYQCAKKFSNEPIVRICADSPFIDPKIIDECIKKYNSRKVDYVSNILKKQNDIWEEGFNGFPIGTAVEVFSFHTLEKIWNKSKDEHYREHVTEYILKNPNEFEIDFIENKSDQSNIRIVVDEKNDFESATNLISQMSNEKVFSIETIVNIIQRNERKNQNNLENRG